jgi:hypothetical protein
LRRADERFNFAGLSLQSQNSRLELHGRGKPDSEDAAICLILSQPREAWQPAALGAACSLGSVQDGGRKVSSPTQQLPKRESAYR